MSNESRPAGYGTRPPFYKRQYIIDKTFQYRLVGTLLCIWAANTVFFTLVLYLLYDGHLNQFYDLVPREGMLPFLTLPTLFAVSILFNFGVRGHRARDHRALHEQPDRGAAVPYQEESSSAWGRETWRSSFSSGTEISSTIFPRFSTPCWRGFAARASRSSTS